MIHRASADFWHDYRALPQDIRIRADKKFGLLKGDPNHGSLQFKKIGVREGREICWPSKNRLSTCGSGLANTTFTAL
jgi:hypothetical protein